MSKRPPGELEGQQGKVARLDGANGLPQVGGVLGYHPVQGPVVLRTLSRYRRI